VSKCTEHLKRNPASGGVSNTKRCYCTGAGCGDAVGAGVVIVAGGGTTVVEGVCVVCESVWLHAAKVNAAIPSSARRWGLEVILIPSTTPPTGGHHRD
jgi:hypothetical protein